MIKGDTPPNHVSESEWKSRLDAMSGKIDWKRTYLKMTMLKYIYLRQT